MSDKLKAFGWFLGFLVITKVVVKPLATQFNVPYLKDV